MIYHETWNNLKENHIDCQSTKWEKRLFACGQKEPIEVAETVVSEVRERHPILTIEEILYDLNGATVFSKLDLKWGFHQITLEEQSRDITTLVIHRELYWYKRLMFGITSAPQKYKKIIYDIIRGCNGLANIADDLIVYGCDLKEHDRNLHEVLQRPRDSGLNLNGDKCQFRLPKLTFSDTN